MALIVLEYPVSSCSVTKLYWAQKDKGPIGVTKPLAKYNNSWNPIHSLGIVGPHGAYGYSYLVSRVFLYTYGICVFCSNINPALKTEYKDEELTVVEV